MRAATSAPTGGSLAAVTVGAPIAEVAVALRSDGAVVFDQDLDA